jgi:chromosome segregation ATPase
MFKFLSLEVVHWDFWERFSLPLDADVITVVGPNGSGKTTLLDALRTLLCIDCSSGRDYKRYVRRSDKPISWLRSVVENKRLESGSRPFFPILGDRVTLACRINKKGGDWQRQYLMAEGDIPVEQMEENGQWTGVREYRSALERAGLTPAISRVLSLEQGDTDKLCEYSPRQLLELVFSVFGDQEVLDNYQQAKNEQLTIGRELETLEDDLAHLGTRLREAELNVNSFREWERLNREMQTLSIETLPRSELADLHDRIASHRALLLKKRPELTEYRHRFNELKNTCDGLGGAIDEAREQEEALDTAESVARERSSLHSQAEKVVEGILRQKQSLEEICRQQETGFDAAKLAKEQRDKRENLAANDHELKTVRQQLRDLQARLAPLKAGERLEPAFVREFRNQLGHANIPHKLLTDIVEVSDPGWQKALEGVLGPHAHIVLLADARDRKRAWELGEKSRYRHYVVAERGSLPQVRPGSLLEVVTFREPPPEQLVERLNHIRRVETVAEGHALANDVSWVTREGFYRERIGGRYIGVDANKFLFGEAARKSLIAGAEKELASLTRRIDEIGGENAALSRRIDEIQALLSGLDAAQQLAARAAEFARAEKEHPDLVQQRQEASRILQECSDKLKTARKKTRDLEVAQGSRESEIRTTEANLRKMLAEVRGQKKQQAERIVEYRNRRRPMPSGWYSRQSLRDLRERYESSGEVRRDIERLQKQLAEGTWVKDEQVVPVLEKLRGDYAQLENTIKVRRIHHHRHLTATEEARESYINVLRATIRRYGRNVRTLGDTAGIGVEAESPHLVNEDLALAQAGLNIKFDFDRKGMIGLNDGEASGGQQVMKSLILLIGLLMDDSGSGGFVFIDEPFAHLDVFNIDKVGAFLTATRSQYVLTTPNTHNVNVFKTSDLTLVTRKRQHPEKWAPPVAFLRREKREKPGESKR